MALVRRLQKLQPVSASEYDAVVDQVEVNQGDIQVIAGQFADSQVTLSFADLATATAYWTTQDGASNTPTDEVEIYIQDVKQFFKWNAADAAKAVFSRAFSDDLKADKTNIPILQSNGIFDITNKTDEKVYGLVKQIKIIGASENEEFYLNASAVKYQASQTQGLVLSIKKYVDGISDIQVCQYFNGSFTSTDDFAKVTLTEISSSGITAEAIVNWGDVSYPTINTTFEQTKINDKNVVVDLLTPVIADFNEKIDEIPLRQSNSCFQILNPFSNINFYKTIKSVRVLNAEENEEYYLGYCIFRNDSGIGFACSVNRVSDDSKVSEIFNTGFNSADNFPVVTVNQFGGSGITAEITVNWSLTSNFSTGTLTAEHSKINKNFYEVDLLTPIIDRLDVDFPTLQSNDVFDVSEPYFDLNIYNVVRDVRLYNANSDQNYYVSQIQSKSFAGIGLVFIVKRESDDVVVCRIFNDTFTSSDRFALAELTEQNNSGITGQVIVDWSLTTDRSTVPKEASRIKSQNIQYRIDALKPVNYERPQLLIDNNYAPTVTVDATTNAIIRPQNKAISFWTNESLKDRNGVQIYKDRLSGNTYDTTSGVVYKSRTLQLAGTGANLGAIDTMSAFYTDDYGDTWNTSESLTPLSTLNNLNNDTNGAGWGIEMIEKYGILISTFVNRQTANDTMYLGWSMDFGKTWDFAIDNQRAKGEIVITDYSLISGNAITIGVSTITEGIDFDKLQGTEATLKAIRQSILDNTPYVAYVDADNNKVVVYNQETIGTAGNGIGCSVTGSGITISATLSGAVNYSSASNYSAYRLACTLDQFNGDAIPDNLQDEYILTNSICDVSDGILFGSHFNKINFPFVTYAIKIGYSDIFDITNAVTTYSLMNRVESIYPSGNAEPTMSYDSFKDRVLVAYRSQTLDGVAYQYSSDKGATWSDIVKNYNKQGRQDNNWLMRLPKSINVGSSGWDDNFDFPTGKSFVNFLGETIPNECYALINGGRYSSNFYVATCDNMDAIDDHSKWNLSNFETVSTIKLTGLSRIDKGLQASDAGELNNIPSFCYDKNVRQFYCFWQDYDNSGNMIFKVSVHKI